MSLSSIAVPRPSLSGAWTIVTIALASLALSAPACGQKEDAQGGRDGGQDITDAGWGDSSAAQDSSAPSDSGANETTLFVDGGTDVKDVTRDAATSGEAGDIDVVPDVASTDDGGTVDAVDATTVDVVDAEDVLLDSAMADADAGNAQPVPMFSECTFVASVGHAPSAIIDVTEEGGGGPSFCACTILGRITIHRVLCGPYLPSDVAYSCGGGTNPPVGQRNVMIIDWYSCSFDAGGDYGHQDRPLTDWDALLAEQIAGHTDGGDGGASIDGVSD